MLTVVGNLLVVLDRLEWKCISSWSNGISEAQLHRNRSCGRLLTIVPVVDQALGPSGCRRNHRRERMQIGGRLLGGAGPNFWQGLETLSGWCVGLIRLI